MSHRILLTSLSFGVATALLATPAAFAQQPAQAPVITTTKVPNTDNVYVFRYQFHQSMFVVTPDGVIATDPIGENRPAAEAYIAEIRKITQAPIRYVVYSHHHADHIAGGKPFKDLGATFVAHNKAKERLTQAPRADIVPVDQGVDGTTKLSLGGTDVELHFVGRNHSDNSLVLRLPKEKVIFAVDFIPVQTVNFAAMPDSYLPDWDESLRRVIAMEWDTLIPGHPGPGGRLGTRQDVQNHLVYMQELSAEVKTAADSGKCPDAAKAEIKMPKYATWQQYGQYLAGNIERYCTFHTKGQ